MFDNLMTFEELAAKVCLPTMGATPEYPEFTVEWRGCHPIIRVIALSYGNEMRGHSNIFDRLSPPLLWVTATVWYKEPYRHSNGKSYAIHASGIRYFPYMQSFKQDFKVEAPVIEDERNMGDATPRVRDAIWSMVKNEILPLAQASLTLEQGYVANYINTLQEFYSRLHTASSALDDVKEAYSFIEKTKRLGRPENMEDIAAEYLEMTRQLDNYRAVQNGSEK